MDESLLDTDTLSEFLKKRNVAVTTKAAAYLQQFGEFTFSAFSRFEIRRGYVDRHATRQLTNFNAFCGHSRVLPISDAIFDQAEILWSFARQGGHPKSDADLLIAATALAHDLVLVTGNTRHFSWMPGLTIED
ncbi:MAG TPA: type II toxin-antitoxin system VapC family toxin [Pirellulales bacterium]|nr:type II toxin-antitoxin system VapC family toxin [Pirellulales bacterium]